MLWIAIFSPKRLPIWDSLSRTATTLAIRASAGW
jgi:hypothetical protein